jgi:hypothetical protein
MEKINNTVKIYVQVLTILMILVILLLISKTYTNIDIWSAVKKIPQLISIYVIIVIIFKKWVWKWNILQGWLVKIPNLEGTWKGELKSDWIDPSTNKKISPIPVILVIRQTFSDIKCTLMTQESKSYSTTADINYIQEGNLYLIYNYTNRPKATIRDRSEIHDGTSILKIIKNPKLCLEGEYWTSRKTGGNISLNFKSKKFAEKF